MKAKVIIFSFWFLIFSVNTYAVTYNFNTEKKEKIEIEKAKKTLRVGEKFVYNVYWMGVCIGEGILETKEIVKVNGRDAYHIVATAKTNEFLSPIYKVEDVIHSYIDKEDLCSLKFEKRVSERKYRADEVVSFDQQKHKGYYESLLNKTRKEFKIPDKVQDLVSAFYYFRTLDVKPGSRIIMDINSEEKNWKTEMSVSDAQELEIVRKGVKKVFCVEPKAPFKGAIAIRSRAWVYFTVDENRVPVLIKIRIPFGFVMGVLERME